MRKPSHIRHIGTLDGDRTAASLLHPLRRRLLEALATPDSASGLARRLGLPRQRLNYHLRALEARGLVELVEERRRGNCNERVLRASAASYLISPELLGDLAADPDKIPDRLSSTYLTALAARATADLARLQRASASTGKKFVTMSLQAEIRFASAPARNAFAADLANEVSRLAARYQAAGQEPGTTYRLIVGAYPDPRDEDPAAD